MSSTVTMKGPIFDGRAIMANKAFIREAVADVGGQGEIFVRSGTGVFKHPTGAYASRINTQVSGDIALVTDSNAVYGPWLEGVGSRNATTRFKGYHFWRKAAQQTQRRAPMITRNLLSRFIGRMN